MSLGSRGGIRLITPPKLMFLSMLPCCSRYPVPISCPRKRRFLIHAAMCFYIVQGAPHSEDKPDEADSTSSGKDSLANFKPPNSRSQALEAVAASPTRIYGLRGLDEYRTGKGGDVGGFRGGGGGDGTDAVGGKNTNRVGNSSEVRTRCVDASVSHHTGGVFLRSLFVSLGYGDQGYIYMMRIN